MSQNWKVEEIIPGSTPPAMDIVKLTDALLALKSNFFGASLPTTNLYPGMDVVLTDGTRWVLNAAGTSWIYCGNINSGLPALIQNRSFTAFTTAGTGTAYTLTPSPAISAYAANQTFDVIFHTACLVAPTLQISGVASTINLVRQRSDGSYVDLETGSFPAGWQSPVKLINTTQALVMILPRRTVTVPATRDMTAATGSVTYSGFIGTPRSVRFSGVIDGTLCSVAGVFDGVNNYSVNSNSYALGAYYKDDTHAMTAITGVGGTGQLFTVTSVGVNTITGTWTKGGTPDAGTLAFKMTAELE